MKKYLYLLLIFSLGLNLYQFYSHPSVIIKPVTGQVNKNSEVKLEEEKSTDEIKTEQSSVSKESVSTASPETIDESDDEFTYEAQAKKIEAKFQKVLEKKLRDELMFDALNLEAIAVLKEERAKELSDYYESVISRYRDRFGEEVKYINFDMQEQITLVQKNIKYLKAMEELMGKENFNLYQKMLKEFNDQTVRKAIRNGQIPHYIDF
jgi:hypothetical protein